LLKNKEILNKKIQSMKNMTNNNNNINTIEEQISESNMTSINVKKEYMTDEDSSSKYTNTIDF
jgi:hypothetical protein